MLARRLGLLDVLAIGINAIVGSGVFSMPDDMHRNMGGFSPLAYALCALVLIPWNNVDALMLRQDVADAIREKRFHVYAVSTVEEGIELLTGVAAGLPAADGTYAPSSVYGRAEARLQKFHDALVARREAR